MSLIIGNVQIQGSHIMAIWTGQDIWTNQNTRGLALLYDEKWALIEYFTFDGLQIDSVSYTQKFLIDDDRQWSEAFNKIYGGLQPSWFDKKCTCGATAVFGKEWKGHGPQCRATESEFLLPNSPKNNDGRNTCYRCNQPTKMIFNYHLCKNKDCNWHDR